MSMITPDEQQTPPYADYRLLQPVRGWIALAVILQIFSSGLVLAPLAGLTELAKVLGAWGPGQSDAAWRIIAFSGLCLAAGLALRGLADLMTHLADNAFSLWIRRQVARRLSGAPLSWFNQHSSGQIKQGIQDDVSAIHHLVAHAGLHFANAAATMAFVYGYLFWIDWRMALITLLPIPLFWMLYRRVMAGSRAKMADYGIALGEVNRAVVEYVQGIPVVKTFGRQGEAHQAYKKAVDDFRDFFLDWVRPLIKPETLASVVIAPITLLLLVLSFGTLFISLGWIDIWQLLPFAVVGLGIAIPVTTLGQSAQSLQMASGAFERLAALLSIPQQTVVRNGLKAKGNHVVFDRVSFAYDANHPILDDISLALPPGSVTAVVGASGAGKSTLARLLLRFASPTSGQITLGGEPLEQLDTDSLYRQVGFVFQDVRLLRISIFDNITLGNPSATETEAIAAAKAANIHSRILQLPRGYQSVYGEDALLSGGEAQRLSIARALLLNPSILVLDEATAQADAESEAAIQKALSTLISQKKDTVVLVIAHRLETIVNADNIVVLARGNIVEQGTHQALLSAKGEYARMWQAQVCPAQEVLC